MLNFIHQGKRFKDPFRRSLGHAIEWFEALKAHVEKKVDATIASADSYLQSIQYKMTTPRMDPIEQFQAFQFTFQFPTPVTAQAHFNPSKSVVPQNAKGPCIAPSATNPMSNLGPLNPPVLPNPPSPLIDASAARKLGPLVPPAHPASCASPNPIGPRITSISNSPLNSNSLNPRAHTNSNISTKASQNPESLNPTEPTKTYPVPPTQYNGPRTECARYLRQRCPACFGLKTFGRFLEEYVYFTCIFVYKNLIVFQWRGLPSGS